MLLLGTLFMPIRGAAEAGLFSALFPDPAYAQSDTNTKPAQSGSIFNNVALLQANVSSASVNQEVKKDTKKDPKKDTKKDNVDTKDTENTSTNIVSDNALLSATGPMGVSDGTDTPDTSLEDTSVYVIRKGDSLAAIAKMFNVSVDTILTANDMKKGDKLVEGDVLFILPIDGIEHTVAKGQTLKGIAKIYKVDPSDIASYNGIAEDEKLTVGDVLMIPGADMSDEGGDKPAPNLNKSVAVDKNYYINHPLQNLLGYFINPLPTGHKTQGLHGPGHRGIDIGAPTGTPIYASASGTVLVVKTGCVVGRKRCGGGYGNMAIIQHPNGTKTLYGHMSKLSTQTGANVAQGELIGYVGSTGHSTGPHLHFEVFNAKNPGTDWSWANN